jgi:hypothetical protein
LNQLQAESLEIQEMLVNATATLVACHAALEAAVYFASVACAAGPTPACAVAVAAIAIAGVCSAAAAAAEIVLMASLVTVQSQINDVQTQLSNTDKLLTQTRVINEYWTGWSAWTPTPNITTTRMQVPLWKCIFGGGGGGGSN